MRDAFLILTGLLLLWAFPARAEFIINTAILEFTAEGPRQQDVELVSRTAGEDYIVTEVHEIVQPGSRNEEKRPVTDPAAGGLLVTPDKTILPGGARKVMRFVLLLEPDERERIYRVAIKPVIKGVQADNKIGLKVLIGYEVLVIVRPRGASPAYKARRAGKILTIANEGNTNVLFRSGRQCMNDDACKLLPVERVYAGQSVNVILPFDKAVSYSVWDGRETIAQRFE